MIQHKGQFFSAPPDQRGAAAVLRTNALTARVASDPPGVIEAPARNDPAIVIHVGPSVDIACRRGGQTHRGLAVHGDVDIVPPGIPSRWEVKQKDTALLIGIHSAFFQSLAEERELDSRRVEIVNRFQMRDPQIEYIGWVLEAEMEAGHPTGGLFVDSLASALALRLLERHSSASLVQHDRFSMSGRKLRLVLSYIEDNLIRDLSLAEVASITGMGISNFKNVFRKSMGIPVHQYVIQRRVERAKTLLHEGDLPIAQVAVEAGFAHQSHLARHLRRATGISPDRFRALSKA